MHFACGSKLWHYVTYWLCPIIFFITFSSALFDLGLRFKIAPDDDAIGWLTDGWVKGMQIFIEKRNVRLSSESGYEKQYQKVTDGQFVFVWLTSELWRWE